MKIEDLKSYEVIMEDDLADIGSKGVLLRHLKTGARVILVQNDDENKVFCIGFRTPPTDSTGLPHILEHSVLCGSEKYPLKDPFVELARSSLNTFLNAMTYPDKTVYPVASCNERDFENLMGVYMDAVFYPNIHKEEKIFRQEGWHYELMDAKDDITINGVVYNEMKGVFSSADDALSRYIMDTLFPDNTYGVESGGDPDVIPSLTYEDFCAFHKRYYHPSNSYIYLYGDCDMAERLEWLDKEYLSKFDALSIDSEIKLQKGFSEPVYVTKEYPITEEEPLESNSYLTYNLVIGEANDTELPIAMSLLDYALCSSEGAPLKDRLMKEGIGTEVYSTYETEIRQSMYSIVAKNADASQEARFVEIIREELKKAMEKGLDKKALTACLNMMEFKYREADFGSYPKGLVYGLSLFGTWLYDENRPFELVKLGDEYKHLRKMIETDYYEQLIGKYLLSNTHASVMTMVPKRGLLEEKEQKLKEKLAAYKASLTAEEIDGIVESTMALKAYQSEEDSEEVKKCLPHLDRSDIRKEPDKIMNEVFDRDDMKVVYHDINTNGIDYVKMLFDVTDIDPDVLKDLGVFFELLSFVDTENYSYTELYNETNIYMSGFGMDMDMVVDYDDPEKYKLYSEIRFKALPENLTDAFRMLTETILCSKFDDEQRIRELISEAKSRIQGGLISSGHSLAMGRVRTYFSAPAAIEAQWTRWNLYNYLTEIEKDPDSYMAHIKEMMPKLIDTLYVSDRMLLDFTGSRSELERVISLATEFKNKLPKSNGSGQKVYIAPEKLNEALTSSAMINYNVAGGNYIMKGFKYSGALAILKVILGYDYLWNNVRVKGGAYGCYFTYTVSGDIMLMSYRDPHIRETYDIYKTTIEFIRNFEADEEAMTKYIIGAFSNIDLPLSPSAKGLRNLMFYLNGMTMERLMAGRNETLNASQEDIRALADLVEAALSFECNCTVGNAALIQENADLFMNIQTLVN